jgi:hypothetical protein
MKSLGYLREMNMKSRKEVTKAVATRYRNETRKGKKSILDEFCKITGYNRDYATSLLRAKAIKASGKKETPNNHPMAQGALHSIPTKPFIS